MCARSSALVVVVGRNITLQVTTFLVALELTPGQPPPRPAPSA